MYIILQTHGPIKTSFEMYDDFFDYKSGKPNARTDRPSLRCKNFINKLLSAGVYEKAKNGTYLGHAVKLIRWSEEFGVKYWLMANSWGYEWGDRGLFKIRRGTNHSRVDNSTTEGVPAVD